MEIHSIVLIVQRMKKKHNSKAMRKREQREEAETQIGWHLR